MPFAMYSEKASEGVHQICHPDKAELGLASYEFFPRMLCEGMLA